MSAVGAKMSDVPDDLLDRAIYSYADVDRLVGLHAGTARRWLEGYTREGHFYDPVLRPSPTGGDEVTWGEMVEARLLAEFRRRDVTVQRLRPAIVELRQEFGRYPLAQARPFLDVEGRELVRLVQEHVGLERQLQLVVVRNGQLVLADSAERFSAAVEYVDDVVGTVLAQPAHARGRDGPRPKLRAARHPERPHRIACRGLPSRRPAGGPRRPVRPHRRRGRRGHPVRADRPRRSRGLMPAVLGPVYFTDENALGLGKLLAPCRPRDVLYPGHERLPEVPLGTPDLDWMPEVAGRGLIVLTRDRRIRTRPAELRVYLEHGIRSSG